MLEIFRDITERKELSDELSKSVKLFRDIWEKSNDAMILSDHLGRVILVNDTFCKMVELPYKELIGSPFSIVYHPDIREKTFNIHLEKILDRSIA